MKYVCGAPAPYGGLSAARKYSKSEFGWMWHCNRRVKNEGDRCWQHVMEGVSDVIKQQ